MAMSPRNIQRIFLTLVALPPDERSAALERECRDLPQLKERLGELLAAHDETGSFPNEAAPELEDTHIPRGIVIEGQVIADRYTLRERIGEGGMGEVWVARQSEPVNRRVALKLIKTGMDSRATLARFEQERQALAMMDHPNIARVLDGGITSTGQPFFVMELVNGLALNTFCDQARLSLQQRLDLFVPICHAVQHAHQKGIVHRDLKPSNILVTMIDGRPAPRIIDFGVAKALTGGLTDETLTQFGAVVGTLEYMSPEQTGYSGKDVDTRADIYSLGVILYELLTGLKPIDKARLQDAALNEMIRIIREEEPSRPSARLSTDHSLPSLAALRQTEPRKLMALLRGELDWVVMKCLEKDRDRRYETANALLRDLQRYLSNEPVEARPPTVGYRLRKFLARNRGSTIAASLLLLTLLAGTGGTTWFAIRATENFSLAQARAEEEKGQRIRAAAAEQLANERLTKEIEATQTAEAAVRASRKSLFDLNTSFGLAAARSNRPAEALLWFAEAAGNADAGSHEEQVCLIRHASWSRSAPRLINRFEHEGQALRTVDYSPAGLFLATLTASGKSTVWDVRRPTGSVYSSANTTNQLWHPQHAWLIAATDDQRVRVIEIPSGNVLYELENQEPVLQLACDPEGNRIAIGGNSIQLWNLSTGSLSAISEAGEAAVQTLSFSRDGSMLLASYDDDRARLFAANRDSRTPLLPPVLHRGTGFPGRPIVPPIFVNQDRGILTKSGQNILWTDILTGEPLKRFAVAGPNATAMVSAPGDETFVVTSQGGQYQVWNADSGEMETDGIVGQEVSATAFTPDGLDLLVQTRDGIHRRRSFDGKQYGSSIHHPRPLQQFRISPDGRQIVAADEQGGLAIWEWGTYLPHYVANAPVSNDSLLDGGIRLQMLSGERTRMKQSPSQDYLLMCGSNRIFGTMRQVTLHSSADGTVADAMDSESLVLDACISRDERNLALANMDGQIVLWQRGNPRSRRLLATVDAEPMRIEFGPDATHLIVLQIDGTVSCFDTSTGKRIWEKTHPEVAPPSFRRQSNMHMYRQSNGFPIMQFESYDFQASDDRNIFATTCWNELACVWNSRNGSHQLPPVRLEEGNIEQIALSPDGRWLAIAGKTTAEVWDIAQATRMQRFDIGSTARSLFFDASGQRLGITNDSGECTIWHWQTREQSCSPIRGLHGKFLEEDPQWVLTDLGPGDGTRRAATVWSALTGNPITPSWMISGQTDRSLGPSKNEHTWHFASEMVIISIRLDQLFETPDASVDERRLQAEILSAERIDRGKIVRLSQKEWLHRIDRMREFDPGFFNSRWDIDSLVAWHDNQRYRALRDDNLDAAQWHIDVLGETLGDAYIERLSNQAEVEFYTALKLARADSIDEAATVMQSVAAEQPDRLDRGMGVFQLESLHKESRELARRFHSAAHLDAERRTLELLMRTFAARFGNSDSRVLAICSDLSDLCWALNLRTESIAYLERAVPDDERTVDHQCRLALLLLADSQWHRAQEVVQYLVKNIGNEESDSALLSKVAKVAASLPNLDRPLAERVLEFADQVATADPEHEGIDLVLGLAQLRAGRIDSAIEQLNIVANAENSEPSHRSIAFSAIAIGLKTRGDVDPARAKLENARSSMPAPTDGKAIQPDLIIGEAMLEEAVRSIGLDGSDDK